MARPRCPVLVNAEAITGLDSTAAQALDEMLDELQKLEAEFGLARVKAPLRERLVAAGVLERIGEDHIYLEVDDGVTAMGGVGVSGAWCPWDDLELMPDEPCRRPGGR